MQDNRVCQHKGVTFFLTCWLGFVICVGLIIGLGAGVAYGYNYCMAEFLTFGKSDVTVYLRRGQFRTDPMTIDEGYSWPSPYQELDVNAPTTLNKTAQKIIDDKIAEHNRTEQQKKAAAGGRRYADGGDENYEMDEDYDKDLPAEPRPLANTWSKGKDTRQYAELLSKYANRPRMVEQEVQADIPTTPAGYYLLTSPPVRRITGSPVPIAHTTMWKTGSSEIVMRRFEPVDAYVTQPRHLKPLEGVRENDEFFYRVSDDGKTQLMYTRENRPTMPQAPLRVPNRKQETYKYIPMRHWGATTPESPVIPDELVADQNDEDSIAYKNA